MFSSPVRSFLSFAAAAGYPIFPSTGPERKWLIPLFPGKLLLLRSARNQSLSPGTASFTGSGSGSLPESSGVFPFPSDELISGIGRNKEWIRSFCCKMTRERRIFKSFFLENTAGMRREEDPGRFRKLFPSRNHNRDRATRHDLFKALFAIVGFDKICAVFRANARREPQIPGVPHEILADGSDSEGRY